VRERYVLHAAAPRARKRTRRRSLARSNDALRRSVGSPGRPAASPSSGPCSTCSSATPATAPPSLTSTATTFSESSTSKQTQTPSTRRCPPPRTHPGNLRPRRIYSGKGTRPVSGLSPGFVPLRHSTGWGWRACRAAFASIGGTVSLGRPGAGSGGARRELTVRQPAACFVLGGARGRAGHAR
jgi:hypothetical protein